MAHKRYNADNAVMLLIDHQEGTAGWMHSGSVKVMRRHTIALAKAAAALSMPVILTSSMENEAQGSLFPELANILPKAFEQRIKRGGTVDSMADPDFHSAVKATGRNNLIIAGLLTEVCVLYPALSAVEEGFDVQVVADASGSGTEVGNDIALARIRQSGGYVASTIQILSELVEDWTRGAGPIVMDVVIGLYAAMEQENN